MEPTPEPATPAAPAAPMLQETTVAVSSETRVSRESTWPLAPWAPGHDHGPRAGAGTENLCRSTSGPVGCPGRSGSRVIPPCRLRTSCAFRRSVLAPERPGLGLGVSAYRKRARHFVRAKVSSRDKSWASQAAAPIVRVQTHIMRVRKQRVLRDSSGHQQSYVVRCLVDPSAILKREQKDIR